MSTTDPTFGWTVPEDSDRVKEGASAMRTLAADIAATMTDPEVAATAGFDLDGPTGWTVIPNGDTPTQVGDGTEIATPSAGLLVVIGTVWLNHQTGAGTSGEPNATVDVLGPAVSNVQSSTAQVGTGDAVDLKVSSTAIALATVDSASTVVAQRYVMHNTPGGQGHRYQTFRLMSLFLPYAVSLT